MNDLQPQDSDYVDDQCPFCKGLIRYFDLHWHVVTDRVGNLIRRRMGPCPHCGQWVKPILVWPDEGDGMRGWVLREVDPYEVEQVAKGQ